MDTRNLGILEIFFGPPWTHEERLSWAEFLGREEMGFYVYGPKADSRLRKSWREPWTDEYLGQLANLAHMFHRHGVKFSVALSPFGMTYPLDTANVKLIETKCDELRGLGLDFLGLFFDDMPSNDDLVDVQLQIFAAVSASLKLPILFCPSYYTSDPILDKVFGTRPPNYLERLGRELPPDVDIAWTGPKVISPEINSEHLLDTAALFRRKPFICDNLFANDGPKNCKFLKLIPARGRSHQALEQSSCWGLNLMNQSAISQLVAYSAKLVFTEAAEPEEAFRRAVMERLTPGFAHSLLRDQELFAVQGLDGMSADQKRDLSAQYGVFPDAAAKEIARWLGGQYVVGNECLTD